MKISGHRNGCKYTSKSSQSGIIQKLKEIYLCAVLYIYIYIYKGGGGLPEEVVHKLENILKI